MKAKRCLTCHEWFRKRDGAKYCSAICYSRSPEQKKKQKEYDASPTIIAAKRDYWRSPAGRQSWRRVASKAELRNALLEMGVRTDPAITVDNMYLALVCAVESHKDLAKSVVKGGSPDAIKTAVEFKFGVDFLRTSQLILDILNGRKGKVRWLPSWDSLELLLEKKGKDESLFFHSYFSYLKWCNSKG